MATQTSQPAQGTADSPSAWIAQANAMADDGRGLEAVRWLTDKNLSLIHI